VEISRRSSWSGIIVLPRSRNIRGVCLIIDQESLHSGADEALFQALAAGVRFFQYRSKKSTRKSLFDRAVTLAATAHRAGALFFVNDHVDVAIAAGADGVHLGQEDLPIELAQKLAGTEFLIGISTHDLDQAKAAQKAGADYIGFGPVFPTTTKDAGRVQGLEELGRICASVSIPVIAIGGINNDNAGDTISAGAAGIAVVSSVLSAPDMNAAAENMVKIVEAVLS
jgi:thiamine-phosphate pyrophosphorylase